MVLVHVTVRSQRSLLCGRRSRIQLHPLSSREDGKKQEGRSRAELRGGSSPPSPSRPGCSASKGSLNVWVDSPGGAPEGRLSISCPGNSQRRPQEPESTQPRIPAFPVSTMAVSSKLRPPYARLGKEPGRKQKTTETWETGNCFKETEQRDK